MTMYASSTMLLGAVTRDMCSSRHARSEVEDFRFQQAGQVFPAGLNRVSNHDQAGQTTPMYFLKGLLALSPLKNLYPYVLTRYYSNSIVYN